MSIFKKAALFTAAAMCTGCLSACASTNCGEDVSVTAESISETTVSTAAVPPEEQAHLDMVHKSFVSPGNSYRLRQKLKQIEDGKETTVAFIGGSITEGYTVQPDQCYAKLTYDMLAKGHTDTVKYVNAGISGTPSILGNLRLQRDVISQEADIVFVEFAVNDGGETMYQESYDSLVKTLLEQKNEPAVILLLNRTKEGHTAQDYLKEIGNHYELPMISTADALTWALDNGHIQWEDYYNDSSHPSPEGHKLFLEFIEYAFFMLHAESTIPESYELKPLGRHGAPYENAVLAEADYDNSDSNLQITDIGAFDKSAGGLSGFRKGWAFNPDSQGGAFKFTVTGNSLFLVCHRNKTDNMGKLDVYINGAKIKTIDLKDPNGWGDPFAYQVIKWQSVKTMEIEVRPAEGYEDKLTEILAIGYTCNDSVTF